MKVPAGTRVCPESLSPQQTALPSAVSAHPRGDLYVAARRNAALPIEVVAPADALSVGRQRTRVRAPGGDLRVVARRNRALPVLVIAPADDLTVRCQRARVAVPGGGLRVLARRNPVSRTRSPSRRPSRPSLTAHECEPPAEICVYRPAGTLLRPYLLVPQQTAFPDLVSAHEWSIPGGDLRVAARRSLGPPGLQCRPSRRPARRSSARTSGRCPAEICV